MAQPEILDGATAEMNELAGKTFDLYSQWPWALLAVGLLLAIGFFFWRVYSRMADALDRMHTETVSMSETHATEMRGVMDKYQAAIAVIADKHETAVNTITDKHATVCNGFMEHLGELSAGVQQLGNRVEHLEGKIKG